MRGAPGEQRSPVGDATAHRCLNRRAVDPLNLHAFTCRNGQAQVLAALFARAEFTEQGLKLATRRVAESGRKSSNGRAGL